MTTSPEIARKVRQLDNDVQALYEMLARIEATQQRHGNRLGEQAITLDAHTAKLDAHTATLDAHTATLDAHTATLEAHTATLDAHTAKLDRIIELLEVR
jgi:septal ring factor EnvC (AmiA/AmiB activator)